MKVRFKMTAILSLISLFLIGCSTTSNGSTNTKTENPSSTNTNPSSSSTNPSVPKNLYTIIWKNWNGNILETDTDVEEGATPTYDGSIPTRPDDKEYTYTWSGWDPEVVAATSDQIYTATYSYEKITITYTIDFDLNGGTSASYSGPKTIEAFTKDIFFFDCVKEGWNFRGWSYSGIKIFDEKGNQLANPIMAKTMTFVAMYAQTAKMTIVSNLEGAGNITGEGEYPYNTYVDVSAHAKQGYDFVGWYYQDTLLSNTNDYKYMMWNDDVTLEARFKLASFLMNVHTNNKDYGLVLLKSEVNKNYLAQYQEYRDYTTPVTIAAYSKTDVRFLGWYDNENKLVETNGVYNFVMPNHDYTLEAKWNYFTVSYDLNGGTNASGNPTSYTIDSNKIILRNPTRTYYDFIGWTYNGKTVTEIDPTWVENITLIANWRAHSYSITYMLNGGVNNPSNPATYTIESNTITLKDPSRNGYDFSGWYETSTFSNQVTTINKGSYGNLLVYAKWSPISYSITYNLNGGTNSFSNPSTYTIESAFTFSSPTKTGYTFLGWYDNSGKQVISIQTGTTGTLTLNAHWNEGNEYTVTLDANGGQVSETIINVKYDSTYYLPDPTKSGYTFSGWYDGSTKINSSGTWKYTTSKTLTAYWTITKYSIKYNLNGGTNNANNPSFYTIDDDITFSAPTKTGYTFLGWYSEENVVTSIPKGSTGEVDIEAKWSADLHTLIVKSDDIAKGTVAIISGSGYSDESITVVASPVGDYVLNGWYHDGIKVSRNTFFTFNMPTNDYTLVAHFVTKAEEEKEWNIAHGVIPTFNSDKTKLTYGLYPQTHVNDSLLIESLNKLDDSYIDFKNGWYFYNDEYYAKTVANPYDSSYKFSDGTVITKGNTYWFKCEPIEWNILSNSAGEYFVLSSLLLDVHIYDDSQNNYMNSEIRQWLNNDFYNSAFALNNSHILTTEVDNSASTTNSNSNPYVCENTFDKVFMPSYKDYINTKYGFSSSKDNSITRECKVTDWAKTNYAYKWSTNGIYWTRSPYSRDASYAWFVGTHGGLSNYYVYTSGRCVRPSLNINIAE